MEQQKKNNKSMFRKANPFVFELAKDLRRNMTDAENLLWFHLKEVIEGLKFRRQHPIGIYIADFYCHNLKLIIELDGTIHNKPRVKLYDERREEDLISGVIRSSVLKMKRYLPLLKMCY